MMPPNNVPVLVSVLAQETGISDVTLYHWRKQARSGGMVVSGDGKNPENWSPQDKFAVVLETAALSKAELAEYCRKKGLYAEQVAAWKDNCLQANASAVEQAKAAKDQSRAARKEIKELKRDLRMKEKALAETAALLVLRKKAKCDLGRGGGRMINTPDRQRAVELINEAVRAGGRKSKSCEKLGITIRTYQRWMQDGELKSDAPRRGSSGART